MLKKKADQSHHLQIELLESKNLDLAAKQIEMATIDKELLVQKKMPSSLRKMPILLLPRRLVHPSVDSPK